MMPTARKETPAIHRRCREGEVVFFVEELDESEAGSDPFSTWVLPVREDARAPRSGSGVDAGFSMSWRHDS
jgi:hypothetical protein